MGQALAEAVESRGRAGRVSAVRTGWRDFFSATLESAEDQYGAASSESAAC